MDGTAPGIYYRQGKNNGIQKTFIMLGGGGFIVLIILINNIK